MTGSILSKRIKQIYQVYVPAFMFCLFLAGAMFTVKTAFLPEKALAAEQSAAIKEESSSGSSASGTAASSKKIRMSAKKLTLVQLQQKKLKLVNSKGKKVKWRSSDKKVATVSAKGLVLAVGEGSCTITARCNKKNYTCRIKVKPLALSASEVTLVRGRQKVLSLNNDKAKPVWESSDTRVATVNESGCVQALSPGECSVTASWKELVLICQVKVLPISVENLATSYPATAASQGRIVLAGSSSMDFWNSAPQAFAPFEVINTAIAGTRVVQWLDWYKELIVPYKPSAVVLYVGSNDIANGTSTTGKDNAANTILLLKRIKATLKNIPIYYIGVCPCWSRQGGWEEIRISNQLVQTFCNNTADLYYIGIGSAFMSADGTPNRANYLSDQLHPSARGYAIWKKMVARPVKKEVRARAKAAAKASTKKSSSK